MQTKYLEKLESILKEKEREVRGCGPFSNWFSITKKKNFIFQHTDRIIKLEEEWRTRLENYEADLCSKRNKNIFEQ